MLRSQFDVIKERNHLKYILEWAQPQNQGGKDSSLSPRSDVASKVGSVGPKSGNLRNGGAPVVKSKFATGASGATKK